MTDIENEEKRKNLNESALDECGEPGMMPQSENVGNPVTMSVTLNASGKDHVTDLMDMLKAAGLEDAKPVGPQMMPMRQDMDRLGDIMRQSEMGEEGLEEYDNEPEETYMDQPKGGGINREKGAYAAAQDGDNAMAVESDDEDEDDDEDKMRESIRSSLMKALAEKKAKPDFLDVDKDGDKKEPMKKAVKDKKKKVPVKESDKEKDDDLSNKLFKRKPGELEKLSKEKNRKMNQKRFMKPGKPSRSGEWGAYESENEAEVQAPNHEMSDVARKAASMAQVIKRKINSGDQMDDRDYNQMAELGTVLSRVGTNFGPKSMKDVLNHMIDYTDERNQEGHKYPEMNVDRFKELLAMAKSTGESMVGEISSDMAKRYTKRAKMDRDFNDDELDRLPNKIRYGSDDDAKAASDRMMTIHRKNSKRQTGLNRAKKRM